MPLTGWFALAFVWSVICLIVVGVVMWTFQLRQPMEWKTIKYPDGNVKLGFFAVFLRLYAGLFLSVFVLALAGSYLQFVAGGLEWFSELLTGQDAG